MSLRGHFLPMRVPSRTLLIAAFLLPGIAASAAAENAIKVTAVTPERVDLALTSNQPATAEPFHRAQIGTQVNGVVRKVLVDIGDSVKKSEALANISVPDLEQKLKARKAEALQLQTAVAAAKANYEAAKSEFQRTDTLVKSGSLTKKAGDEAKKRSASARAEFDAARATADVADAMVGELEALVNFSQLTAPFDGVVTIRDLDPGDLVRTTDGTLLQVEQLDPLRVVTYLPEREAVHLDIGDEAALVLDAFPGLVFTGKISRIAKSLDPKTRSMRAEMDLKNPNGKIPPGLYGRLEVVLEKKPKALVLPPDCIRSSDNGPFVYVIGAGGKIAKKTVQTGLDDGKRIEITEGLNGSEKVVGGMIGRLNEGDTVEVIND